MATDTSAASTTSAIVTVRPFATRALRRGDQCLPPIYYYENFLLLCDISLIKITTSHKTAARGHGVAPEAAARQLEGRQNAADGDQSVAVVATGGGV